MRIEVLKTKELSVKATAILDAMTEAMLEDGHQVTRTNRYIGISDLLMMYGVGHSPHDQARKEQVAQGKRALLWDLGYFGLPTRTAYMRMSLDADHPPALLDSIAPDPSRWDAHGIELREDFDPRGPVILAGLGRKSRAYLGLKHYERDKLAELKARFPRHRIILKQKEDETPITTVLKGASLLVCRHSNCSVDAAIAGIPIETENGAAAWLKGKPYTPEVRLDFLRRLAWLQWRPDEAAEAWKFIKGVI